MEQRTQTMAKTSGASLLSLADVALRTPGVSSGPAEFRNERKSVFCIATHNQADEIVAHLQTALFSPHDISVAFSDQGTLHDFSPDQKTKSAEGTLVGAGMGGVLGVALGWMAGLGALALYEGDSFAAAGPVVGGVLGWVAGLGALAIHGCDPVIVALSMGAVGAAVLGLAGGRIGRGIPNAKQGGILIAVHTNNSGEIARAKGIFTRAGARDGCKRGEASVEDRPAPGWTRPVRRSQPLTEPPRHLKSAMPEWMPRLHAGHSKPPLGASSLFPA